LLLAQVWLNIASVIGYIPAKGLTLPLISYGGSSLIVYGIIFGILIATSGKQKQFTLSTIQKK
jgi:cell division protein FtsW